MTLDLAPGPVIHSGPFSTTAPLGRDVPPSRRSPLGNHLRGAIATRKARTLLRVAVAFLVVSLTLSVAGGSALIAAKRLDPSVSVIPPEPGPLPSIVILGPEPASLAGPRVPNGSAGPLVPAALFASQDANGDGRIDMVEAKTFYDWVRDNLTYRWDDENMTTENAQGRPIGDGRVGRDYQQTPLETITEGFGDCEDLNGLQLAFYTHWNIPAYLAYVNALSNKSYDHAVAIVFGATTLEEFRTLFGDAPFYQSMDRPGIHDGFYFIVDNAFSHVFAQVSGGMGTDKFVIHHVASYGSLFGNDWKPGEIPTAGAVVAI